jgi:hypothetical protein
MVGEPTWASGGPQEGGDASRGSSGRRQIVKARWYGRYFSCGGRAANQDRDRCNDRSFKKRHSIPLLKLTISGMPRSPVVLHVKRIRDPCATFAFGLTHRTCTGGSVGARCGSARAHHGALATRLPARTQPPPWRSAHRGTARFLFDFRGEESGCEPVNLPQLDSFASSENRQWIERRSRSFFDSQRRSREQKFVAI